MLVKLKLAENIVILEYQQCKVVSHHSPHVASQSECCKLTVKDTIVIQVSYIDLNAGVVLCCDELVGPRAAGGTKTRFTRNHQQEQQGSS